MKKALLLTVFCAAFVLCFSSCWYDPPEGWTKTHHTYEEALEYAQAIDPDASAAEEHTDTDEDYREYREWDAVINGVDCHVASVSAWVWNSGIAAGEFARDYYRLDTDHDNFIMQRILSEKYPDWKTGMDIHSRYNSYNMIFVKLELPEFRMLDDEELEDVWQTALLIREEFDALAIGRKAAFCIPAPGIYWGYRNGEDVEFVKRYSHVYFEEFTEEARDAFLREYRENWALLESDMPVYDED